MALLQFSGQFFRTKTVNYPLTKMLIFWHFSKGLVHGCCCFCFCFFFSKIELFLICVFLQKSSQKRSVFWYSGKKKFFLHQKIEVLNSSKHRHFSEGLVHGFCPKIELFLISVFCRYYITKDRFLIFWIEKNAFRPGNWSFKSAN